MGVLDAGAGQGAVSGASEAEIPEGQKQMGKGQRPGGGDGGLVPAARVDSR